jgi:plasmid stabilization system protein ParE
MAFKVLILEEAKRDIKEARTYYKKIFPSLSKRFTADLKNTITGIQDRPFSWGFRFDKFRTANFSVFPYQVHYVIVEVDRSIVIFAVLHSYRNPDFIQARKNS